MIGGDIMDKFLIPDLPDTYSIGAALRRAEELSHDPNQQTVTAELIAEQILKQISEFNNKIDDDSEVGIQLVSYGQTIQFYIDKVGYINPSLIRLVGFMDNGNPIELLQHITQLSFVLIRAKKLEPEKPKRRIGFVVEDDQ